MKILSIMSLVVLIGACGDICNKENACSSSDSNSTEEETAKKEEVKDEKVEWTFTELEDAKASCLVEDYVAEKNMIRYCQCKIEIISNGWSYKRYGKYPFTINRGLEDSGILDQCNDYANTTNVDIPELDKDVKENITKDIKEKETEETAAAEENNESASK